MLDLATRFSIEANNILARLERMNSELQVMNTKLEAAKAQNQNLRAKNKKWKVKSRFWQAKCERRTMYLCFLQREAVAINEEMERLRNENNSLTRRTEQSYLVKSRKDQELATVKKHLAFLAWWAEIINNSWKDGAGSDATGSTSE